MSGKITWSHLPASAPDGSLIPHLSARMRTQVFDVAFHMLGGVERLVAWAESSDENYADFIKLYGRGQARATSVEHGMTEGVEKMLEQLDEQERAQNAKIITGTATHVDT